MSFTPASVPAFDSATTAVRATGSKPTNERYPAVPPSCHTTS